MAVSSEQIQTIGEVIILVLSFVFGHKHGAKRQRNKSGNQ